jgi:hypothetical protein
MNMATEPITIHVAPEAARAYNDASPEEREHLDFILSLQLLAATQKLPPLLDLMDDISRKAQERGLTREMLEEILSEE